MMIQTMEVNRENDTAGDASFEVRNLDFAYGPKQVLHDVSFTLRKAPIGLLGPNGSGKTTLLRALLGHLRVKNGAVYAMGHDMARDPYDARRRIGWMPERGGIIPGMSGVSMVAYLGELSGMPRSDSLQRAHEVLNYVGLADERYRMAETYSQGMRQRLKLAQALVHDPDWIFLDEPTSGLDPSGRISMLELMRDLALKKGFGVIISTHLLADVKTVCSEILVLRDGRLLEHGTVKPDQVSDTMIFTVEGFGEETAFLAALEKRGAAYTRDDRVYHVTTDRVGGAQTILEAAAAAGYALRRLQKHSDTLEDVFFRLVDNTGEDA